MTCMLDYNNKTLVCHSVGPVATDQHQLSHTQNDTAIYTYMNLLFKAI